MAKKEAALGIHQYEPSMHMEIKESDLDKLKKLKLGQRVSIVVTGKVKSIEEREDYDDPKKKMGSLCLRGYKISIADDENVFTQMADEED